MAWWGLLLQSTLPASCRASGFYVRLAPVSCPYSSVQHIPAVPRSLLDVVYATSETFRVPICCCDAQCLCPAGVEAGSTQAPCVLMTVYPHHTRPKHAPGGRASIFPAGPLRGTATAARRGGYSSVRLHLAVRCLRDTLSQRAVKLAMRYL